MSVVTDVVLCASEDDQAAVDAVNHWIKTEAGLLGRLNLAAPAQRFGGSKWAQHAVWAAAFNHLDLDALLSAIARAPWQSPAEVSVTAWPQDQQMVTVRLQVPGGGLATVQLSPFAQLDPLAPAPVQDRQT